MIAKIQETQYPESDGIPMGETDLHRDWMVRILDLLRYRYRGQHVYVASNLLVYFEEGNPLRFIVPDDFVVLDCAPGRRRVFKTWEEKRTPNVVFEVTSRATRRDDLITKPKTCERIGVAEYFLYDPTGHYLKPALQGFRLVDDEYAVISDSSGCLACETLGLHLALNGDELIMTDTATRVLLLTEVEAAANRIHELEQEIERLKRGRSDS